MLCKERGLKMIPQIISTRSSFISSLSLDPRFWKTCLMAIKTCLISIKHFPVFNSASGLSSELQEKMKNHDIEEGTGLLSQRNCISVNSATEQAVWLCASYATSLNLYFLICNKSDNDFYPMELVHRGLTSLSSLLHSFLQVQLKTERKKLDIFFTCKSFWQMCLFHHAFRNTEKGSRVPVTTHSDPQLVNPGLCLLLGGSRQCNLPAALNKQGNPQEWKVRCCLCQCAPANCQHLVKSGLPSSPLKYQKRCAKFSTLFCDTLVALLSISHQGFPRVPTTLCVRKLHVAWSQASWFKPGNSQGTC